MLRILSFCGLLLALGGCQRQPAATGPDAPAAENSAQATDPANPDAPPEGPDWRQEYEQLASAVDLSDAEAMSVRQAFEDRSRRYTEWMTRNGKRLAQLDQQMKTAARSRDLSGVRAATSQASPLRQELRGVLADGEATVRQALTVEHRVDWDGWQLSQRFLNLAQPLELTAQQQQEIALQARQAAGSAATTPNPSAEGFLQLERAVEKAVLTPAQREAYESIKKASPLRSLKTRP